MRYREACGTITAAAVALLAFGPARAPAQQVVTNGATVVNVDQVDQYDMTFANLVGMNVSWTFAGGGSGSGTWAALGGGLYGVSGTGSGNDYFSLKSYGIIDTYGALFIDPYVWSLQGHGCLGIHHGRVELQPGHLTSPSSPRSVRREAAMASRTITTAS